jgi:MFS family permease
MAASLRDRERSMELTTTDFRPSLRSVEWLNFFLADVQTGLGPFLAAYLAASGWSPGRVGYVLAFGGIITVLLQIPAGAVVDAIRQKRALLAASVGVLVAGALLLLCRLSSLVVYLAQFLIGGAAPFLGPTVAAITLGIVGAKAFDKQFGTNQAFNSAGNVFAALVIAFVSYQFGYRMIFFVAALLAIPTLICLSRVNAHQIDYARARGGTNEARGSKTEGLRVLLRNRSLLLFLLSAFLFHLANAAMLPELGELLTHSNLRAAAPFMSACIIVTQVVIAFSATWIGRKAGLWGRKPLLLIGFGVLPIRGILYTLTHVTAALVAIQTLDGIANAIFVVVSILVIADLTRGTGCFNLASGALATAVGTGAALSNAIGGQLIQRAGFSASFLGLAAIAFVAVALLWLLVPETLVREDVQPATQLQAERKEARIPGSRGVELCRGAGDHRNATSRLGDLRLENAGGWRRRSSSRFAEWQRVPSKPTGHHHDCARHQRQCDHSHSTRRLRLHLQAPRSR